LVRTSDSSCRVESGGEVLEILGKQVPAAVESDLNRRMAEMRLDGLGGRALGDQESGAGMPQVMNPQILRHTCCLFRRAPYPFVEVGVSQRTALGCGEHQSPRPTRPQPHHRGHRRTLRSHSPTNLCTPQQKATVGAESN